MSAKTTCGRVALTNAHWRRRIKKGPRAGGGGESPGRGRAWGTPRLCRPRPGVPAGAGAPLLLAHAPTGQIQKRQALARQGPRRVPSQRLLRARAGRGEGRESQGKGRGDSARGARAKDTETKQERV